jgi:hypothetical protein
MRSLTAVLLAAALIGGCAGTAADPALSTPRGAHLDVSEAVAVTPEEVGTLLRYFSGNERWEVRRRGGLRYAILRPLIDGQPTTTLNGFWSSGGNQTRVLVAFGGEYGFGLEHGNITRARAGSADVPMVIESDKPGTPGTSSYLIVQAGSVNIEIYDQSPAIERTFTAEALAALAEELAAVRANRAAIQANGLMPVPKWYHRPLRESASFSVLDGFQPGIYRLCADVSPPSAGYVEALVIRTKDGVQLSAADIQRESMRYVGWSRDGATFFPYQSEITVYEGDWDSQYEARFELWHVADDGTRTRMAERTRMINGWER